MSSAAGLLELLDGERLDGEQRPLLLRQTGVGQRDVDTDGVGRVGEQRPEARADGAVASAVVPSSRTTSTSPSRSASSAAARSSSATSSTSLSNASCCATRTSRPRRLRPDRPELGGVVVGEQQRAGERQHDQREDGAVGDQERPAAQAFGELAHDDQPGGVTPHLPRRPCP
jgi:hypothetical protein